MAQSVAVFSLTESMKKHETGDFTESFFPFYENERVRQHVERNGAGTGRELGDARDVPIQNLQLRPFWTLWRKTGRKNYKLAQLFRMPYKLKGTRGVVQPLTTPAQQPNRLAIQKMSPTSVQADEYQRAGSPVQPNSHRDVSNANDNNDVFRLSVQNWWEYTCTQRLCNMRPGCG